MAQGSGDASGLGALGRQTELRQRLLFVLMALVIYRLGSHLTIPGIDQGALSQMFQQQQGTILDMFNMFSGGALKRLSIFALGVMPVITAQIILNLMIYTVPSLERLQKEEGEAGRRQLTKYRRYGTLGLATFQGIGITYMLQNQGVVLNPGPSFVFIGTVTLATGTMFLMWLGEQITERGIGNGISLLIFAGIVAGLPGAIAGTLEQVRTGSLSYGVLLFIIVLVAAVLFFIVFMERGQRRITIQYARRQQGRHQHEEAGDCTEPPAHLPQHDARQQATGGARGQCRQGLPICLDCNLPDAHRALPRPPALKKALERRASQTSITRSISWDVCYYSNIPRTISCLQSSVPMLFLQSWNNHTLLYVASS